MGMQKKLEVGLVCSGNEVLISDFFVINLSKEIEHSFLKNKRLFFSESQQD